MILFRFVASQYWSHISNHVSNKEAKSLAQECKYQLHILLKLLFTNTTSHLQRNSVGQGREFFQLPQELCKQIIARY